MRCCERRSAGRGQGRSTRRNECQGRAQTAPSVERFVHSYPISRASAMWRRIHTSSSDISPWGQHRSVKDQNAQFLITAIPVPPAFGSVHLSAGSGAEVPLTFALRRVPDGGSGCDGAGGIEQHHWTAGWPVVGPARITCQDEVRPSTVHGRGELVRRGLVQAAFPAFCEIVEREQQVQAVDSAECAEECR